MSTYTGFAILRESSSRPDSAWPKSSSMIAYLGLEQELGGATGTVVCPTRIFTGTGI